MINKKAIFFVWIAIALCFFSNMRVYSQFESYPDLDWYTIETEHFTVTYHAGTERTAQTIAKIAEEVYGPITSLYNYPLPDKVNFVVSDVSDVANGATDFYGNRIEIFASALDFDLRGTHNWLRNVITHEFTHMVQLQAAMKFAKRVPAIYLQWLNYETERRPDVLYGYPNVIVSYPISGFGVPSWFAEGVAQYQRQQMGYDYWDAHRDMILRSYVTDDNMLTWNEMGQFSSITSLKAESIYNSGFALTRYISEKYGEEKLRDITKKLGDLTNFSVDKAIKQVLGKDGDELYNEWKNYLKNDYAEKLKSVKETKTSEEIIEKTGFANYFPHFSPDGKKVAYLSNQDFDYARTGLFLYDMETKKTEMIAAPVSSNFSWSPDGKKIMFAERTYPPTIDEISIFDLYEFTLKDKSIKKLTDELRAFSPSYSFDGEKICFVVSNGGTLNLYIADKDAKNKKALTNFSKGEQIYNPRFSHDGKRIYFDFSLQDARNIAYMDIEDKNMEFVFRDDNIDTRNPVPSPDGKKLYFSSDRTGIFNIYSYDFETKEVKQITNVEGGALMPSIINGSLAYATYKSTGYKVAVYKDFLEKKIGEFGDYNRPEKLIRQSASEDSTKWNRLKNFNDKEYTELKPRPYKSMFTQLSIFPVIRYDNYSKSNKVIDAIKPGIYIYSDEIMSRYSIFGGISMNHKFERDIFFQFTYNNGVPFNEKFFARKLGFAPKFDLALYNVSRKSSGDVIAGADSINVGVNYDLLAIDFGMAFKIINTNHELKFTYNFSKYAASIDGFLIPSSGIFIRGSSEDYFRANALTVDYNYEVYYPSRNTDINPVGRKVKIQYQYEGSKINPEYTVDENNNLLTVYKSNRLHKLDANWLESVGLFDNKHSLALKLRAATVFGPQVDEFYSFYASGLPGMKGYPFYALGGGRLFTANLTYRFPILSKIDMRISPFYLDKLYFGVYGDWGNAWDEKDVKLNQFKKDIGAELRLQMFSAYAFPTSLFFNAAYGFDSFTKNFQGKNVTYGKEVRYYFGMLFGFDL
ncbi:MAG: PD40 domain-containing protein [Ignavibacteriae bacterium]|nr:PD40 domain-containing protein [Ignavibacteriota bacterium]